MYYYYFEIVNDLNTSVNTDHRVIFGSDYMLNT